MPKCHLRARSSLNSKSRSIEADRSRVTPTARFRAEGLVVMADSLAASSFYCSVFLARLSEISGEAENGKPSTGG